MKLLVRNCIVALLTLAASTFPLQTCAQDRYRLDQPQVLTPPPQSTPPPEVLPWAEIKQTLARTRQNRVVVFWDIALKGDVSTSYDAVVSEERRSNESGFRSDETFSTGDGSHRFIDSGNSFGEKRTRHAYSKAMNPQSDEAATPLASQAARAQFMDELRRGGIEFVDRTLTTRLAGASTDGQTPNVQALEIKGLTQYADLLLQVNSQPDASAQFGRSFHVSMRDLHNGRVLFDFFTRAEVPVVQSHRYVAGAQGFELAKPRVASASESLHRLAVETGQYWLSALRAK